jgi:hypothetical protein
LRLNYSADLILLEVTFISGRPRETRLGLLKALNDGLISAAASSPDDLVILFYEIRERTFRSAAVWLNGLGSRTLSHRLSTLTMYEKSRDN